MAIKYNSDQERSTYRALSSSHSRQHRSTIIATVTVVCLLLAFYQIISLASNRPSHACDRTHIRESLMNNLSVQHLLRLKPVRSKFFEYELVNEKFCGAVDLLIVINSKSRALERRQAIRRTYGNLNDISNRLKVRILFFLQFDESQWKTVQVENDLFRDIVQVKLPEEYHMDTHRDLAMFDWSATYCPQARLIFKMDESVFFNPFLLLKFINDNEINRLSLERRPALNIEEHCPTMNARLPSLYGFLQSYEDDVRGNKRIQLEQILTSPDGYPCDSFPPYFNDHAYLISSNARDLMLCVFYRQSSILLPISNIYITGILAEYLSIERRPMLDYHLHSDSQSSCEQFFGDAGRFPAFACVTSNRSSTTLFGQYQLYWQLIVSAQTGNTVE